MLNPIKFILFVVFAYLFSANTFAENKYDVDFLLGSLDGAKSVDFFFVSMTGSYILDEQQIKSQASVKIHRKCGSNCRRFMKKIVLHLEQAVPAKCQRGQENVLIEIGVTTIVYSHSGRMMRLNGRCYFNKNSIAKTIKAPNFIFD